MKTLICALLLAAGMSASAQSTPLNDALARAKAEHKLVLLRFSGSDWCIPCIRMEKELFSDSAFHQYANARLISVQADFPRQKKHQLPKAQQQANEALADRYDPQGSFPLLVLLDADGRVLRRWEGVDSKAGFLSQLESEAKAR